MRRALINARSAICVRADAFSIGESGWTVDGDDPVRSNCLRFCNHSVRRANCEAGSIRAFDEELGIFLKASRPINQGEELFFNYGDEYWADRAPSDSLRRVVIDLL